MNRKKGFTLIEILMALGIFSVITGVIFSFLSMGIKSHSMIAKEYDIQSDMRVVSQTVNNVVREAKATFIKNKDNIDPNKINPKDFTNGWNYIIYDKKENKILQFTTPTEQKLKENPNAPHTSRVLAELNGINGLEYDLKFIATSKDMLEFNLYLKKEDGTLERSIETELKAINTLGGIDCTEVGGLGQSGNTLAYSTREMSYGKSSGTDKTPTVAVSMVLDTSGSMEDSMGDKTRIGALKDEANILLINLSDVVEASNGAADIRVSLIPFSNGGNVIKSMESVLSSVLIEEIKDLRANGGTNTGDGMRLGLQQLMDFNTNNEDKKINNFMIILVDGATSMSSIKKFEKDDIAVLVNQSRNGYNQEGDKIYQYIQPNDGNDGTRIRPKYYFWHNNRKYYHNSYSLRYEIIPIFAGLKDKTSSSDDDWRSYGRRIFYNEIIPAPPWGIGNDLDYIGTKYTEIIGNEIKNFTNKEGEHIKTYVIAFTNVQDEKKSCADLGRFTNAQKSESGNLYFDAGSQNELKKVFELIKDDIKKTIEIEMGGDLDRPN